MNKKTNVGKKYKKLEDIYRLLEGNLIIYVQTYLHDGWVTTQGILHLGILQ